MEVSLPCHFFGRGKEKLPGRTDFLQQETEETNGGLPLVGPASAGHPVEIKVLAYSAPESSWLQRLKAVHGLAS